MTDLAIERRCQQDLRERNRMWELSIPVPAADSRPTSDRSARAVLRGASQATPRTAAG